MGNAHNIAIQPAWHTHLVLHEPVDVVCAIIIIVMITIKGKFSLLMMMDIIVHIIITEMLVIVTVTLDVAS